MIKQTRIRCTKTLLRNVKPGETFVLGVEINEEVMRKLTAIANDLEIKTGVQIFPDPELGIMSERNAIGEHIPQKNLPKEIAYRAHEWELRDWGGYLHRGISYVPYQRYRRKFIAPKEFRIEIVETSRNEQLAIVNQEMVNTPDNQKTIIFGANLMLEIFGAVDTYIVNKSTGIILSQNVTSVDWEIFPQGQRIWDLVKNRVQSKVSASEQRLIHKRLEFIEKFRPTNVFQGIGGYSGYLVFEFIERNLYVFDSVMYGNATYIFKGEWREVSKLTKKEVIDNQLAVERIIHNDAWCKKIIKYLH